MKKIRTLLLTLAFVAVLSIGINVKAAGANQVFTNANSLNNYILSEGGTTIKTGNTIKLTSNVTFHDKVTLELNESVNIDLNGCAIFLDKTDSDAIKLKKGTLNVINTGDSSWGGSRGTIESDCDEAIVVTSATLNLTNVIVGNSAHSSGEIKAAHNDDITALVGPNSLITDGFVSLNLGYYRTKPKVSVLYKVKSVVTEKSKYTYTGKEIAPKVVVKDYEDKVIDEKYYDIYYCSVRVNVGTYDLTLLFKGDYAQADAESVFFKIEKANNPMKVTTTTKKVKYKDVKKKKRTVSAITVKNSQGTKTYVKQKGSSSKLTVNKTSGKITVKKGTKKGKYKIKVKVTAAGNKNYKSLSKTVTVTIKVV